VGIVVITAISLAFAGEDSPISAGNKQMIFGFAGWNLTAYKAGFGFRYFVRDGLAIRPGIDFGVRMYESDSIDRVINPETPETYSVRDDEDYSVRASIMLERYVSRHHNVHLFYGGGLGYSYSHTEDVDEYRQHGRYDHDQYDTKDHGVDVTGFLGAQWYFTDSISLGGEYKIVFTRSWSRRDAVRIDVRDGEIDPYSRTETRDSDTSTLDTQAGQLMVAIRF
jgi:hypothetical protein